MKTTDELNPNLTVNVSYGDSFKRSFKVTRKNLILDQPQFTIPAAVAGKGQQNMTIDITGRGKIYYSAFLKYFTKEDPIKGAGHEVYVTRSYSKLTPKEVTRYRREWNYQQKRYVQVAYQDIDYDRKKLKFGDHLKSGDLIEVNLAIKANNNFEYLMFEDPKPAGCEPVALKSGSTYQGGFVANMELRDTKVGFFVTYLRQGNHSIKYKLRAEIPGIFNVMSTQSQAMYSPHVRGISDSFKMNITDTVRR
ncbi:MAG: alpha-2-macroglobulin, partial [Spirochaetota bacterium]|nr:alpha-2-macroglobulin [Spirochaetota bacterium]